MDDDERRALEELQASFGRRFTRPDVLLSAVTHRSYRHESNDGVADNERLEFLGDAIVNLAASLALWARYPDAPEGEMTRRRAALVSSARLAEIARELGLGAALRVGRGEGRSGGRDKDSLLGDALEAVVAAAYVDGGLDEALALATRLLAPHVERDDEVRDDWKSLVQQRVQAGGGDPPRYRVVEIAGPDHERRFRVQIVVGDVPMGEGEGRSKKEAEQAAAHAAHDELDRRAIEIDAPDGPREPT